MSNYLVVRIAPWSLKHLAGENGQISKKSILEGLKAHPNAEFHEVRSGACLTVEEARESGVKQLNVRYNSDRDFAVIELGKEITGG